MTPIKSQAAPSTYITAICFFAFFLGIPSAVIFVKSGDWHGLAITAALAVIVLMNVRMIHFECNDAVIMYRSLLKGQEVRIDDITGVTIGPVDLNRRAPQFVLNTKSKGNVVIQVRVLPKADARLFAAYLISRGIPFTVDPGIMSKRMAAQILPDGVGISNRF